MLIILMKKIFVLLVIIIIIITLRVIGIVIIIRQVSSADFYFRKESVCPISVGKEFHSVGATQESKRNSIMIVCSRETNIILLSEEECIFLLGV